MNYYEIRDRVPCEEIDALTVEAARAWLTRNGWKHTDSHTHIDGILRTYYLHSGVCVCLGSKDGVRLIDASRRMCELVTEGAAVAGKRAHVVIAEIRAIAEWQKRCAEWVEVPQDECSCFGCYVIGWHDLGHEGLPEWIDDFAECPTCYHRNCPRATDHRLGCSGSNEAGQEGSRYA